MKFEDLLKKTTPGELDVELFGKLGDQITLLADSGIVALICAKDALPIDRANAIRLKHSWNVLPRLLRAVEAEREAHALFIGGADNSVGRWTLALEELHAAIAAAKEAPE